MFRGVLTRNPKSGDENPYQHFPIGFQFCSDLAMRPFLPCIKLFDFKELANSYNIVFPRLERDRKGSGSRQKNLWQPKKIRR